MKIGIVTDFSPTSGGGAVIVRSLVGQLPQHQFVWNCIEGPNQPLGENIEVRVIPQSGSPTNPLEMLSQRTSGNRATVVHLLKEKYDAIWLIAHWRASIWGLSLMDAGLKIHVSMHDDIPHAQFQRSRKLRLFRSMGERLQRNLLQRANTVDTVWEGMQSRYKSRYGVDSCLVHRWMPAVEPRMVDGTELGCAHIGALYGNREITEVCAAMRNWPAAEPLSLIGGANLTGVSGSERVKAVSNVPEDDAVRIIRRHRCGAVLYPFTQSMAVFRQTSSPTKLTTYIRSATPILALAPSDSSAVAIVERYGLGVTCTSNEQEAVRDALDRASKMNIGHDAFARARDELYGHANVDNLERCLTG